MIMKLPTLVFCFLFVVSANLLRFANSASDAVIDVAGHEVRPGENYFIVPTERQGKSGGIAAGGSCPHEVVLTLAERTYGLPVKFSPVNHHHERVVRTNTDLNIKFIEFQSTCHASKVWKYDANKQGKPFVTTGGVEGKTGSQSLPNWFKIQKFEDAYKLEYCPSPDLCGGPCVNQAIVCRDIGVVQHEGSKHVAVQPPALKIKFKKF